MLSSQEEQAERRRVFAQDQSLRNQGSTFHQHAQADANTPQGRFSQVNEAYVVGAKADVAASYPACSPALAVQLPDEPPLGLDNPALNPSDLEPLSHSPEAQGNSGDRTGDVPASTLPLAAERVGSPLSSRKLRRLR